MSAYLGSETLQQAAPILLAGLGGLMTERAGVINFALEGKMIAGAFAAAAGAYLTGDPFWGLAFAVAAGVAMAALHGLGSITLRGDQIVSSFAVNFVALGLAGALMMRFFGTMGISPEVAALPTVPLGPVERWFGRPSVLTLAALAAVPVVWAVLWKTRFGLALRCCGADPRAAAAAAVRVSAVRWIAVLLGGALAGAGGGFLVLAVLKQFTVRMIAGRGFIAVAAVILSGWRPGRLLAVALLIGLATAAANHLQGVGWLGSAEQLILVTPFVFVLIASAVASRGAVAPAGLARWPED